MNAHVAGRRARWWFALVSLCALATCPAAQRQCAARQTSREAPALLGYLVDRIRLYAAAHHALPDVAVGPTPAVGACCGKGPSCAPDPMLWQLPSWRTLGFSIDDRHHFSYQVRQGPSGLVLTAIGDQDCDGVSASYEVTVTLDGQRVLDRWSTTNPLE